MGEIEYDYMSYRIPISVKGIVFEGDAVWLRKNERNEWELPGGKIDKGEQPEETVVRELREELGFITEPIRVIQAYLYTIQKSNAEGHGVLVVSYLCKLVRKERDFEIEGEAGKAQFRLIPLSEVENLTMPNFYKEAIRLVQKIN